MPAPRSAFAWSGDVVHVGIVKARSPADSSSAVDVPDAILIARWQRDGDERARDQVVQRYEGFVRSFAARYSSWGEPFDDVLQVAWIGLLKAIQRFDVTREVTFATYATPTVVGEIRRHYRDRAWAVHVPRGIQELRVRVNQMIDRMTAENGQAPTVQQIAGMLDVTPDAVLDALQSDNARRAGALPMMGEDGDERELEFADVEQGYAAAEARITLEGSLGGLDDREREILALRFSEGMTQSQIAARIGVSQMHVSRLLRRSLDHLRANLGELAAEE